MSVAGFNLTYSSIYIGYTPRLYAIAHLCIEPAPDIADQQYNKWPEQYNC